MRKPRLTAPSARAEANEPASSSIARYHRARRRRQWARRAPAAVISIAAATAMISLIVAQPPAAASARDAGSTQPALLDASLPVSPVRPTPHPSPVSHPSTTSRPVAPVERGYAITVTATGFQKQLDECQWVRMNIGAAAPIVGAHNYCGGAIVLGMKVGETVTLAGEGVTGSYVVSGSRDAYGGENAALATRGMVADLLLQTCYYDAKGRERLVELTKKA